MINSQHLSDYCRRKQNLESSEATKILDWGPIAIHSLPFSDADAETFEKQIFPQKLMPRLESRGRQALAGCSGVNDYCLSYLWQNGRRPSTKRRDPEILSGSCSIYFDLFQKLCIYRFTLQVFLRFSKYMYSIPTGLFIYQLPNGRNLSGFRACQCLFMQGLVANQRCLEHLATKKAFTATKM